MSQPDFNPAFATTSETAAALRGRKISARELLALTYQRIDRHNPALNAIVWQDRERAMAARQQADKALAAGTASGAFLGVPVTIKESFAYRGSPNTWGLPPLKGAPSPRTAVAVERLESAGAIVVGKTNVPVMLADWQSNNPIYGTTNNPWDLTRTPGGSTGGGAAALAAGMGCLALGSDLSGSIRIPAHFCGVYGHKPTLELIDTAGFQPGPWEASPAVPMDLSVVGPLARGARDLALALEAVGGPAGAAAIAWTWRLPRPRHTRLRDFRIGYVMDDTRAPVSSDVTSVYERVLTELSLAGAMMESWLAGRPRCRGTAEDVSVSSFRVHQCRRPRRTGQTGNPLALDAGDAAPARLPRDVAEVFRNPRRLPVPGGIQRRVSARPQPAAREACRRNNGRPTSLSHHALVDDVRNAVRPSRDDRARRTDGDRVARGHTNRGADVGGRNRDRVCRLAFGRDWRIHTAARVWSMTLTGSWTWSPHAPTGRGMRRSGERRRPRLAARGR